MALAGLLSFSSPDRSAAALPWRGRASGLVSVTPLWPRDRLPDSWQKWPWHPSFRAPFSAFDTFRILCFPSQLIIRFVTCILSDRVKPHSSRYFTDNCTRSPDIELQKHLLLQDACWAWCYSHGTLIKQILLNKIYNLLCSQFSFHNLLLPGISVRIKGHFPRPRRNLHLE